MSWTGSYSGSSSAHGSLGGFSSSYSWQNAAQWKSNFPDVPSGSGSGSSSNGGSSSGMGGSSSGAGWVDGWYGYGFDFDLYGLYGSPPATSPPAGQAPPPPAGSAGDPGANRTELVEGFTGQAPDYQPPGYPGVITSPVTALENGPATHGGENSGIGTLAAQHGAIPATDAVDGTTYNNAPNNQSAQTDSLPDGVAADKAAVPSQQLGPQGGCFTRETLALLEGEAGLDTSTLSILPNTMATRVLRRIDAIALGNRVIGENPEAWNVDTQWPEPEQASWVQITATSRRSDRAPCELQILRPRAWAEQYGLVAGATLPLNYPELKLTGSITVHAVEPAPPIDSGTGHVVIGRFVTREINNLVRVTLSGGTVIESTDNHPIWSVDRQAFLAAEELQPGERLQGLDAEIAVERVERVGHCPAVFNLEVHGQHVFHIAEAAVLVHNADYADGAQAKPAPRESNMLAGYSDILIQWMINASTSAIAPTAQGPLSPSEAKILAQWTALVKQVKSQPVDPNHLTKELQLYLQISGELRKYQWARASAGHAAYVAAIESNENISWLAERIQAEKAAEEASQKLLVLGAAGGVPVVGETIDAVVLFHPDSSPLQRVVAGSSLAVNALTMGLLPNFGSLTRSTRTVAKNVEAVVDEVAAEARTLAALEKAPSNLAPLAKVFDGHGAGQGFTGVFDSATGKILLKPSTAASEIPPGWVARGGGHANVSGALGGNAAGHQGFAVILQQDGTLAVTWRSGVLNRTPDALVPLAERKAIVEAIEKATGKSVSSY
jgi:hypothetical protein